MSVDSKKLYDGYRTQESRDLAMLQAALAKDPSIFGDMDEAQKKEYEDLIEWIKTVPPGTTIDVPYNME